MKRNSRVSLLILTMNSERTLIRTLKSANGFADELIVVDGYSNDKSVEIARKYGAKVVMRKPDGFGPARNAGLEAASGDWIFDLDSDETMSESLKIELNELCEFGQYDVISIPRFDVKAGRITHFLGPDYNLRFYRKGVLRFTKLIHENNSPQFLKPVKRGYAKSFLMHYNSMSFAEQYRKNVRDFTWMIRSSPMSLVSRTLRLPYLLIRWPLFLLIKQHLIREGLHGLALAAVEDLAWIKALSVSSAGRG